MRLLGWVLSALALAVLALPGLALAHAQLERAEPPISSSVAQAPEQLRLVFSEPLDASFSRVQVLDVQRQVVDRGDSRVAPDDPRALVVSLKAGLSDGIYTVAWRTLSAVDGHTVDGAYPLIVGTPPPGAEAATVASSQVAFAPETAVARWWFFVAASVLFGMLLAWAVVFAPLLGEDGGRAWEVAERGARRLGLVAGALLVVGTLYAALAQAATAADVPLWDALGSPLVDVLTRGRYALVWWPRLALATLALGLVAGRGTHGWAAGVALAAAAGALLTSSLNSHAAALASGAYLGVAADWLHFLGVAAWIGGLASLVFVLPAGVQAGKDTGGRLLAGAIARFSNLALLSVGVIGVTGVFQAWLEVGSWEGLWQTAYGLSVSAKVALMALMLALAAFNLLVARPRLAALAVRGSAIASELASRLAWAVRGELVLGLLVLVVAAVLTGLAPARDELARRAGGESQAGPLDRRVDAQGLAAQVRISPNSVGQNHFAVALPGTDPAGVERVQLTLTYLDAELGSQPLVLEPSASSPSTWEAHAATLSQPGQWQAELLVRRANQDDARTALRFVVAGPGVSAAPATPSAAYPLLPSPIASGAYALVAAGGVALLVAFLRRGPWVQDRRAGLLVAGLVMLLCGGYVYQREQSSGMALDVAEVRNPIAPDERSLADGRAIYEANCATCHGQTGRGDGPAGAVLTPRPADLRVHMAAGHTDGQIFYWVSFGVQGTAMPAWQGQLSEQDTWDVINYIRTFAAPTES